MWEIVIKDAAWKIYKCINNGTELICIDKTSKYKPTKYSFPVRVCISVQGDIYTEN